MSDLEDYQSGMTEDEDYEKEEEERALKSIQKKNMNGVISIEEVNSDGGEDEDEERDDDADDEEDEADEDDGDDEDEDDEEDDDITEPEDEDDEDGSYNGTQKGGKQKKKTKPTSTLSELEEYKQKFLQSILYGGETKTMDEYGEDDEDEDEDQYGEGSAAYGSRMKNSASRIDNQTEQYGDMTDDEDDDGNTTDEEDYLKKFNDNVRKDFITMYHPEIKQSNYDEISALTKVVRDSFGNIIDPLHTTIPILTRFERARILGIRAKQINSGAEPFIDVPNTIIEGRIIAEKELEAKAIPFIISRPLPNGRKEYWRVQDLEVIDY